MSDKTFIDLMSEVVNRSDGILMGAMLAAAILTLPVGFVLSAAFYVPETEIAGCKTVNENDKIYLEVSAPCKALMQELSK